MKNSLETELAVLILDTCQVEDVPPDTLDPNGPIIGEESPLGLDSLDAVEIVMAVEKQYDVRIGGAKTGQQALVSLSTLAEFIRSESGAV